MTIPIAQYRIKFNAPFKDGNISPQAFRPGQEAVVTGEMLDRIRNSGGSVDVLETVIPNPRKSKKEAPADEQ